MAWRASCVGGRVVAGEPDQARQPAVRVPRAQMIAELAVLGQRQPPGLDRRLNIIGQVALVRAALEQLGALGVPEKVGEAQRAGELSGGLTVCAHRGGALPGPHRVAQHRVGVSGRLGMMGDPGQIPTLTAGDDQRLQGASVQGDGAVGRQRLLHHHPRDLVPERDAVAFAPEHPRGQAALQLGDLVTGQGLQQPQLGVPGHDRHRVDAARGRLASSRAARASTASRTLPGIDPPAARASVT